MARLTSVSDACKELGWKFTAVQLTDSKLEHPWGDTKVNESFPILTLKKNTRQDFINKYYIKISIKINN